MTSLSTNTITVKYFARLREEFGIAEVQVNLETLLTIEQLWQNLHGVPLPETIRYARNQQLAAREDLVEVGDEIAFFPPVTGG